MHLFIITKENPHKKGSHKGIIFKKLIRLNVSTPVFRKRDSDKVIIIKPKIRKSKSFDSYFMIKEIIIIIK